MRILLTGAKGQVGWELIRALAPLGEVLAHDRQSLDLADGDRLRAVVTGLRPEVIVNAAAYTQVDQAESEASAAFAINATAPALLAEIARANDALLVHYSTDYVFDGQQTRPYREDDPPAPLSVYGKSKLAGEQAIQRSGCRHLIFRTSWVYAQRGRNFLLAMLRLAREREELAVVADQTGAPTWARTIAEATALALARYSGQQGLYHMTASGATSWHGFAERLLAEARRRGLLAKIPPVCRIATAEYPTAAKRPMNSRLDCSRLARDFGLVLPRWETQLALCLDEMGERKEMPTGI